MFRWKKRTKIDHQDFLKNYYYQKLHHYLFHFQTIFFLFSWFLILPFLWLNCIVFFFHFFYFFFFDSLIGDLWSWLMNRVLYTIKKKCIYKKWNKIVSFGCCPEILNRQILVTSSDLLKKRSPTTHYYDPWDTLRLFYVFFFFFFLLFFLLFYCNFFFLIIGHERRRYIPRRFTSLSRNSKMHVLRIFNQVLYRCKSSYKCINFKWHLIR